MPSTRDLPNIGVVAHAAGDLRIEVVPEPRPRADEAVIEVAYGGVCGSDLHYWRHGAAGASILREPMILGHEIVGTVLHPATEGGGPLRGTAVAVHPLTPHGDGVTPWPTERPNLAPASTYLGSAMHLPHTQGGFARRIAVPTRMLHALPSGLDLRTAALAEPAAVAWHGIERAGDVRGRRLAVIGAGPIGLLAIATAWHHGATEVVATDVQAHARAVAQGLGARVIDARSDEEIAALHADIVVESSGTVPGLTAAISATRRGGAVVLLGLQRSGDILVPMSTAITRELTLAGSFRFAGELPPVLSALADASLGVDGIVTHTFDVLEAMTAFEVAADAASSSKVLIDFGGGLR